MCSFTIEILLPLLKTLLFPFLFRFTLYAEGHIRVGISDKRYTSINSDFNSGIYDSYFMNFDL